MLTIAAGQARLSDERSDGLCSVCLSGATEPAHTRQLVNEFCCVLTSSPKGPRGHPHRSCRRLCSSTHNEKSTLLSGIGVNSSNYLLYYISGEAFASHLFFHVFGLDKLIGVTVKAHVYRCYPCMACGPHCQATTTTSGMMSTSQPPSHVVAAEVTEVEP